MKTERPIAIQIVDYIRTEKLDVGTHLPAQRLADFLHVSRSPINEALKLLHEKGLLRREPNRGYFVAQALQQPTSVLTEQLGLSESSIVTQAYLKIADDLLDGNLPTEFSETLLKNRYDLTNSQLQSVLSRIRQEGWANKKPGYGWVFSTMLTTPDSLMQSYRLRLVVEPAALLEPGYRLDPNVLKRCREAEMLLLQAASRPKPPTSCMNAASSSTKRSSKPRATRSSSTPSAVETVSAGCSPTARSRIATTSASSVCNICTSSNCSKRGVTAKPRANCASTS